MEEIRRIAETAGSACECYINPAEIKQGSWQEDPSHCLRNCKAQFLRGVLQGWEEDLGWIEGCRSLNRSVPVREFWSLYWCDSIFCGVGIDPTGPLGQDPTVDLIINTCQNIGFHFLLDPGPPPQNFSCSTEAEVPAVCSATVMQVPQTTQAPQRTSAQATPATTASRTTTTAQPRPNPAVVTPVLTSSPPVSTKSSTPTAAPSTTSGSGITGQGKAAIAICAVLALMLIVCFALLWLRRRKRRKASFHRALRSRRGISSHEVAPAGSPTPLISPASSAVGRRAVLTPPLRLRDRKFLPSILRSGSRSPSPPLTPLTPAYSLQSGAGGGGGGAIFSSSPICSPTTNKLVPRHERTLTPRRHPAYSGNPPPSLLSPSSMTLESTFSLPVPAPGSASGMWPSPTPAGDGHHHHHHHHHHQRGSASASSCYTGQTGTSTAHSSLRHEIPIAIPSIVGPGTGTANSSTNTPPPPPPLSPPPTRALPRPPPPASPPPPPASVRGGGGGGVVGGGDKAAGLAGISPTPTVLSGSLPPPALGLGRAVMGPGESSFGGGNGMGGGGKSPPPPPAPSRFGESAVSVAGQHQPDYGRPPPAYSFVSGQAASDARKERVMSRGSWGSWSAAGKVVGSGSCGAGNVNAGAGVGDLAQTEIREEGKGGGDGEERR